MKPHSLLHALPLIVRRTIAVLAIAVPALVGPTSLADADVLTTIDGMTIEGKVEKRENGWYRVTTAEGVLNLAPDGVKAVEAGKSPRAALEGKLAEIGKADVRRTFALALEAEAAGLLDIAELAFARVLAQDPDHAAARRALDFERLDGRWVTIPEARRAQGLVLYRGRWMLPEEVETAGPQAGAVAIERARDAVRVHKLIRKLASEDAIVKRAARIALAKTDDDLVVAGARSALLDGDPAVRRAAAGVLGTAGDESALRALIFSGARDMDPEVRRASVEAAQSFGHDDTAVPFVRALGSKNLRLAANAAQALAQLGDERAAGYIVKRLSSHGSSTRNFVAFMNQVSYVRDYDVEIAQASNIANPDVATINDGVVLDVKVLDAGITKTWIEPILVDALSQLAGRPLRSKAEALNWWAESGGDYPDFPKKPRQRAPCRREGWVVGLQDG